VKATCFDGKVSGSVTIHSITKVSQIVTKRNTNVSASIKTHITNVSQSVTTHSITKVSQTFKTHNITPL